MSDPLIESLAADLKPVNRNRVGRRLTLCLIAGLVLGAAVFWLLPGLTLRADLADAIQGTSFWMKAGFTAVLAIIGYISLRQLSRPGGTARAAVRLPVAVWLGLALIAAVSVIITPVESWSGWILRPTALRCVIDIVLISLPIIAVLFFAVRQGAPTRLAMAGWASGLAAGGIAATIYGMGCPESSIGFLAVWYALGILLTGLIGALAGRHLLRW
ncbi:NrsF family protein [Maricaulis sp.]|uniref:NrsF family protein n=1 Tax=Maricaulis sp. TaxID=1486257 RepID=UPI003A92F548